MASFDYNPKSRKARFFFRYDRKQFNKTLPLESSKHAEWQLSTIEQALQDLARGKLTLPDGADPGAFIMSGGKVATKPKPVSDPFQTPSDTPAAPPTIASIFAIYEATLTPGSKEANSIYTEAIHGRHFKRVLGADRRFDALSVDVLQDYVNERATAGIVRDTIHKELTTIRVVWGWALKRRHIASPLAWKIADLTMPKSREKPTFQTWGQIERKIARGGLTSDQEADLWESLWLDQAETLACLEWVRERATRPFIFPMFAFVAYTGARRSEMLRSERDDWDFEGGVVSIRQKKSDKTKSFTKRTVPIHPALAEVMKDWFANNAVGTLAIATEEGSPIDPRVSTGYFRRAVRGGKWEVVHGWHTFRHSLASNLASRGIDPRQINDILGHSTGEMERRYRHLCPKKQASALNSLFQPSDVK